MNGSRNVIAPNISTIYSTYLNNNTGTHPTTVTYNTPTTPTNNVTSRTYSTTALTGHVFGNSSATSHAATTTTYGGGTGVGSRTITLAIAGSGNPSQNSSTTHGVTINFQPRIISTTSTSTIVQNVTDVIVQTVYWQGYTSSGFTARVINSSGTTINSNGTVSIVGSNFTNSVGVAGAGGAQTIDSEWFAKGGGANVCNLGTISATGNQTLRITSTGAATDFDHPISITGWNNIAVVSKSSGGWSNQEDAVTNSSAGAPVTKYFLGTLANGTTLYNSTGTSSPFNGGGYYHDNTTNGYIMTISSVGVIGSYTAYAQAQPLPPTSVSADNPTANSITVSWNNASAIDDEIWIYYVKSASNNAHSGNTSWGDNPLSNSTTSDVITGLDTGDAYSFAVYSKNGNTLSTVGSGNRDYNTTVSPPSWGSQPSLGTIGGVENQIRYSPVSNPSSYTITLNNPDSSSNGVSAAISDITGATFTTITCIVSTGTIANSASGWSGTTTTTASAGSSDTIHFRFKIRSARTFPQGTENGTFDFTLTNGGVTSTYTNVSWAVGV